MIAVVMGVSGCGKSTVGQLLATRLQVPFLDADEFHPPENVAKMASGIPLTDADRQPWLELLNAKLHAQKNAVLACSALKESHRQILSKGIADCRLVHLRGSLELIRSRLADRKHRYMPASLLESQFATLEPPRHAIDVDISQAPERCVEKILADLVNLG
jgi:gluconokinase